MLKRTRQQQYNESLSDMAQRYRGVILVITVPLFLICFVLFLMPMARSSSSDVFQQNRKFLPYYASPVPSLKSYAVIFDAGSSGSRVHVFRFDQNLDLMHIGRELELFVQATAGLIQLGNDASEKILQAVKDLLKTRSSLKSDDNWVTVLDGTQEGAYQWVTISYLLKRLGKKYSDTVGVVDLGGGSVQMAYAISEAEAAKAPKPTNGEDTYVKELLLMGTKYYLYVHSYLHYGLLAARAEILKTSKSSENPCVLSGYNGILKFAAFSLNVTIFYIIFVYKSHHTSCSKRDYFHLFSVADHEKLKPDR